MTTSRGLALTHTLLIVAATAMLLVGAYYFFVDPYASRLLQFRLNDMVSAASVPDELADAMYLLTPTNGSGMYWDGTLRYDEYNRNGSFVLDVAYAADRTFELIFDPSSRLYTVTVDGKVIFSSKTQLLNLFVSGDAALASVSVRDGAAKFETEPASWTVAVIDVQSGAIKELEGFAAVFPDNDTALVFRSEGIFAVDYESGEERLADDISTSLVYPSIAQNANRSKIAWTTLTGELYVYDVLQSPELSLAKLKMLKTQRVQSRVALTDQNLYELVLNEDGRTDILRYAIFSDETSRVRSLPGTLSTTKLIP